MVPGKIDAYYLPNPKTMIMNVYAYIDTVNMDYSSLPSPHASFIGLWSIFCSLNDFL